MSVSHPGDASRSFPGLPLNPKGDAVSLRQHNLPFSSIGAENIEISFIEIRRCLEEFNGELKRLSNEAMQLGRVSGLLWSIKKLRKQLSETEGAFLLNAASLNPDIYHSYPHLISLAKGRQYDELPLCLHDLAMRLHIFRNRLDEFHEQTDEGAMLRAYLNTFIRNIKYRAHCIEHYQGVPAIRYEQKRASEKFFNMSTVATLFSGVTASTLQMSISTGNKSLVMFVVNVLWLCALVFSVGATLNSLLSMAWRQARAGSRAPTIISWWISSSPAAFLVLAISSFSAGLIVFAYASEQALFTAPLTIAATAITFVGLIGVAFGMLYEQWISHQRYTPEEIDINSRQDVSSIMTASTASLVKSEGDWFDEEGKNMPKEQVSDSSPPVVPATERPRLQSLARKIGIQHLVLTKLHGRQPSQKGPPSPLPKTQSVKNLKSIVEAVVAQQPSRSKPAHPISSITIAKRHGLLQYSQFSPNSPHLAVTWLANRAIFPISRAYVVSSTV
ncbi:hypothetical protein P691DRAFT_762791 [Macrolepiota fuliginosa MF-IS2]|uniref:Uncharacterized protein n=1 Tax=Macrolepiota fuliginosa MF-IS2 TaxID=1400762 RepID=A0A9P5X7I4_9AGAR|nr:hypothetical protein P691DRAFT_762791 [Macrolepiota fuliginosa MF-IS2]